MAGAAPEFAAFRAFTFGEFLDLGDSFASFLARVVEEVSGDGGFEGVAGAVVPLGFAGVVDAGFAFEVALLADAVAGGSGEFRGVHDVGGGGGRVAVRDPRGRPDGGCRRRHQDHRVAV